MAHRSVGYTALVMQQIHNAKFPAHEDPNRTIAFFSEKFNELDIMKHSYPVATRNIVILNKLPDTYESLRTQLGNSTETLSIDSLFGQIRTHWQNNINRGHISKGRENGRSYNMEMDSEFNDCDDDFI